MLKTDLFQGLKHILLHHKLVNAHGLQLVFLEFNSERNDINLSKGTIKLNRPISLSNYQILSEDLDFQAHLVQISKQEQYRDCCQERYSKNQVSPYYLIPIPFVNIANIWLLYKGKECSSIIEYFFDNNIYSELIAFFQGFIHRYLEYNLLDRIPFTKLPRHEDIVTHFVHVISDILLCNSFKIGFSGWTKRCLLFQESQKSLVLQLGNTQAHLKLSYFPSPYSDFLYETQLTLLKNFLESTFQKVLDKWKISQAREMLNESALTTLITDLKVHNDLLKRVYSYYQVNEKNIASLERILNFKDYTPPADYEFYKGSTGWHIRFAGEVIKMDGHYDTGLNYIHMLLSNSSHYYYANQLEIIRKEKNKHQPILLNISSSFSIELDINFTKSSPITELELLSSIKRLSQNRPPDDNLEELIYYLSEMFYQAYCLKELNFKSEYLSLFNNYKQELDEYIFILKQQYDDDTFVDKILKKSGVIKRRPRIDKQLNRLRDRVVKSIKNAIKSMDSKPIREHFSKYLTIGTKSIYAPKPTTKIDWKLSID